MLSFMTVTLCIDSFYSDETYVPTDLLDSIPADCSIVDGRIKTSGGAVLDDSFALRNLYEHVDYAAGLINLLDQTIALDLTHPGRVPSKMVALFETLLSQKIDPGTKTIITCWCAGQLSTSKMVFPSQVAIEYGDIDDSRYMLDIECVFAELDKKHGVVGGACSGI